MVARLYAWLEKVRPARFIGWIIASNIVAMAAVVVLLPSSTSSFYGVGFADDYDLLARNISRGEGYRFRSDTALTIMREPGYPLFLAGVFKLADKKSLNAARVANVLLAALAIVLLYSLAMKAVQNRPAALLAALLFMVHPGVLIAELRGGVELLFIVGILLSLHALLFAIRSERTLHYFLAGIMVGLTTLVRSTILLFPSFVLIFFFFWPSHRGSWPKAIGRMFVVFAGIVLMLSPWVIRNWEVAGAIIPTSSVQSIAAHAGQYICSHRTLDSDFIDLDYEAAHEREAFARSLGLKFKADGSYYEFFYDTRDELRFNTALSKLVMQNYRNNPELLIKCPAINVFNFWFTGKTWASTGLNVIVQLPYLIAGMLGMLMLVRAGRGSSAGLVMLFVAYLMLVHIPVHAQARYSVPLIPLLAMFAAVAVFRSPLGRDEAFSRSAA